MLYCNSCAISTNWPIVNIKSQGKCELCGFIRLCNDVQTSQLPVIEAEEDPKRAFEREVAGLSESDHWPYLEELYQITAKVYVEEQVPRAMNVVDTTSYMAKYPPFQKAIREAYLRGVASGRARAS